MFLDSENLDTLCLRAGDLSCLVRPHSLQTCLTHFLKCELTTFNNWGVFDLITYDTFSTFSLEKEIQPLPFEEF
jgi:hypothetical protein